MWIELKEILLSEISQNYRKWLPENLSHVWDLKIYSKRAGGIVHQVQYLPCMLSTQVPSLAPHLVFQTHSRSNP